MTKYLLNCFLLLIPVIIWNLMFYKSLPQAYTKDIFWKDIPAIIGNTENILRYIVFILPLFMTLTLDTKLQKIGLGIYVTGIIIYFLSWIFQLYFPDSFWSKSLLGFMAPAYSTLIWLVGIGIIGSVSFVKIPFMSAIYIGVSVCFVVVRAVHAYLVFQRL